tara:strand:- start:99 stop:443 length:345 start_codon:yes stop_codon:yes gene_type:complete
MVIDEFCFSGGLLPPPKKKTTRKKTTRKKKKKTSLVYCSLLYSIIYSKICEMLCRCKSCVVKEEEEEEDDEKFFEKALQRNETKQRGERHLRKIQNFYRQILVFFDVCALIYDF